MALQWLGNYLSPKHVVVIDDDPSILRIFGDILRKKKYKVTTAPSLEDLGNLEELETVDLFLLDCFIKDHMPGPQAAVKLREEGFECPICFITAKRCTLEEEKKLKAVTHDTHFIEKPVSPANLIAIVGNLVGML